MSDEENETEFGLVMPFVVCASQGGPYDDDSYVAGYEAGKLDAELALGPPHVLAFWPPALSFHAENKPQLDLVAMKNGYTVRWANEVDGWVGGLFAKNDER
jgi:hypothetical protein